MVATDPQGMRIIYYKDPVGNFGDDLNELIWPRVLPADVRATPDIVLVGIGSLLDQSRFRGIPLVGRRVFVLGSGAGYGKLPDGWQDWTYLAVRGQLTARLIGKPGSAVTDGAALLARLPGLVPRAARPDQVLFMPHHYTLINSHWQAAAERAGMMFVSPNWAPDRILACYGRARLVVTEAMHGAIVADALRIPWVPALISPEVSVFKWRDWASSLGVPYRPVTMPPTARLEAMRYWRISRINIANGRSIASADLAACTDDELLEDLLHRFREEPAVIGPVDAPGGLKSLVKRALPVFDGPKVAAAAVALRAAAAGPAYLSNDAVFADRLARLEGAVERLVDAARHG